MLWLSRLSLLVTHAVTICLFGWREGTAILRTVDRIGPWLATTTQHPEDRRRVIPQCIDDRYRGN